MMTIIITMYIGEEKEEVKEEDGGGGGRQGEGWRNDDFVPYNAKASRKTPFSHCDA